MKITAGLGSVDDYPMYVEAGADECFCGYVPFAWAEKYGVLNPLNRREVRAYNVQIGSYEELKILGNMRKYYQVPVAITFNSLSYSPLPRYSRSSCHCGSVSVSRFLPTSVGKSSNSNYSYPSEPRSG